MKFSRLVVIIYPLIIWLLAQVYFFWPESLYITLGISVALTLAFVYFLKKPERKTHWLILAILPVSFLITVTAYISLQSNLIFIQVLFLALTILLFNYFKSLYYFWCRPDLYKRRQELWPQISKASARQLNLTKTVNHKDQLPLEILPRN
jgi:carbon starvation protein CstA